jgi:sugar O-acyltransferase (sialic acid O-acetyltransferase NeuD family)
MKEKIVIVGGGEYANGIISLLKKFYSYEIIGYTDMQDKGEIFGIKYLGNDSILWQVKEKHKSCKAVIGIGMLKISSLRNKIYEMLKDLDFELPVLIAPNASISNGVSIGEGTVILENAIAYTNAKIGKCCMIHQNAIVEHDCVVNDFVSFATGAIMAAGTHIGKNSILSVGAIVVAHKTICDNVFIGAGSVVINDISLEGSYFGVPARKIPGS